MTVEVAGFVSELNTSWPLNGDLIKEGDDHIRLIKSVLQNTFAGFNKRLTITSDTLNLLNANLNFDTDSVGCNKTFYMSGTAKTFSFNKDGIDNNKNVVTGVPLPRSGSEGLDDAVSRRYIEQGGGMVSAWPVGSIYITISPVNPQSVFNFGTWEAFAQGRTLVGMGVGNDGKDSNNFNVVMTTGGEYNHVLTQNEMPNHTHPHTIGGVTTSAGEHWHEFMGDDDLKAFNRKVRDISYDAESHKGPGGIYATTTAGAHSHSLQITGGVSGTGGGQKHNVMMPYITVYMFRRTA